LLNYKQKTNDHRLPAAILAQTLLALIAACIVLLYLSQYARPYRTDNIFLLSEGWQLQKGPGSIWSNLEHYPADISLKADEALQIRRTLSEKHAVRDGALMLVSIHQRIQVFLDETLLFDNLDRPLETDPGVSLHFVALPEQAAGKNLLIKIWSPYAIFASSLQPVYLGNLSSLHVFAVKKSILYMFLSLVCVLGGFVCAVFSALPMRSYVNRRANLFFGLFCILWGIYSVGRTYIAYLLFPPDINSFMRSFTYTLYPVFIIAYLRIRMVHYKRATDLVLGGFLATAFLALVLPPAFHLDYYRLLSVINPLYQLLFLIMVVLLLLELRRGNVFLRFISPCVAAASIACLCTIIAQTMRYDVLYNVYVVSFFGIILTIWFYNLYEFLQQRAKDQEEIRIMKLKNALTLEYCEATVENLQQIKLLRHEINNHASALQILCEEGDVDKISAYVQGISRWEAITSPVVYSNHFLLNCILTNRFARAYKQGIRIDYEVMVPKDVPIPDNDLSSLFLNLLNNAIEACMGVPENKRWIQLYVKMKNDFLLIRCSNSKENALTENGAGFLTTKQEKGAHGYGILVIKAIVEKYGSLLDISYDDRSFTLKTMLPVPPGAANAPPKQA